jgi:hypothetical protein
MPKFNIILCAAAGAIAAAGSGSALGDAGLWQPHRAVIQYFARGTSYSCMGIEDKVRQILRYAGARDDLSVRAAGCDQGPFMSSHMASVNVQFYALAPAADPAAPGSVPSHWAPVSMTPWRSRFLQDSDCDLVRAVKSVVSQSFSWQGLEYDTSCFPYQAASNSFAVKGTVLKPDTNKPG